jgi:hypothetical protein
MKAGPLSKQAFAESLAPRLLLDWPQLFAAAPPAFAFQPQDGLQQSQ